MNVLHRLGFLSRALYAGATFCSGLSSAAMADDTPSAFQCNNLEQAGDFQVLEGKDGMFFRIIPDIKMFHPFTDATVENIAKISNALKAEGTTLIYVPVPTKSMILPDLLPEKAKAFGFQPAVTNAIYDDVISRLQARGVIAVDIASPMRAKAKGSNGDLAFFRTDFHWTAQGAGPAAQEIARRLVALPNYTGKPGPAVAPVELPVEVIQSTMRKIVQRHCRQAIPAAAAHPYKFETASSDIFGEDQSVSTEADIFATAGTNSIALVGTSFSDMNVSNFAGFLGHYTGLAVENYSISGGNQFGSILSLMTSREFKESKPKYIVWENPIYNSLAQFGDGPLVEILAAAQQNCRQTFSVEKQNAKSVLINLGGKSFDESQVILADIGENLGRKVKFQFTATNGIIREREVERGERLRSTGRYFLPLNDMVGETFSKVSITFDADLTAGSQISLCSLKTGDTTQ
jgi:alginate biosynthesis protein AlgX